VDDQGGARVLPVTYALAGDALVSAVDHKRKEVPHEQLARVRWLRARPRAALTVDHYEEDWSRLAWVQALGPVEILDAEDAPDALAALTARYAQYRDHAPAGPVLSLAPDRIGWWRA
jgi:PPOX class probable F420-dependent enzyme